MAMRARLLLVGTPVMLAGSGLLLVAAARERWAAACPFRGDHETDACLDRQSSLYDFLPPTQPWVGFGHDAALAGAALLVLAVAAACLPALMLGVGDARPTAGRPRPVARACALVLSGGMAGMAWLALVAARTGEAAAVGPHLGSAPAVVCALAWVVGWPAALVTLAVVSRAGGIRAGAWRWLTVLVLTASTPLVLLFLVPAVTGYVSYDTVPWTEAYAGALLVLAAPAAWRAGVAGARQLQPQPGPVADRSRRVVMAQPHGHHR